MVIPKLDYDQKKEVVGVSQTPSGTVSSQTGNQTIIRGKCIPALSNNYLPQ